MVEPGNAAKSALAINADANSGSTRLRVRAELPDTRFGVHVLLRALGNTELEVPLQLSLSWRAETGMAGPPRSPAIPVSRIGVRADPLDVCQPAEAEPPKLMVTPPLVGRLGSPGVGRLGALGRPPVGRLGALGRPPPVGRLGALGTPETPVTHTVAPLLDA